MRTRGIEWREPARRTEIVMRPEKKKESHERRTAEW